MKSIKATLHAKRVVTEEHMKELEREGKEWARWRQSSRYADM